VVKMEEIKPENYFYTCDGKVLKNFVDFSIYVSKISNESFSHHVRADSNDFSNWIRDILKKKEIASDIEKIKTVDELKAYVKSCSKSKITEKEKRHGIIAMIKEAFS